MQFADLLLDRKAGNSDLRIINKKLVLESRLSRISDFLK